MSVEGTGNARHWAGFLFSGSLAFLTDAAVSWALADGLDWPWAVSRIVAIAAAMVVAFLCHRRLTFAMSGPATGAEFGRFVGVAWSAAAINYSVFLALRWFWPGLHPVAAIGVASVIAMGVTYLGLRFAVFRR